MSEQYLVHAGGRVKSFEGGRIGGRIVTFSGHRDPDRANEFFDGSTDFWLSGNGERRPILYRHGADPTIKRRRFGEVLVTKAADGLWASGHIAGRDADSQKLLELAEGGLLNWSTGSVGHLVSTTLVGTAQHLDEWPIAEVSLCAHSSVAEPRNIISLKEFALATDQDFYSLLTLQQRDCNERAEKAISAFYQMRAQFEWDRHERVMRELGSAI